MCSVEDFVLTNSSWILSFNGDMRRQNRHVVLLVDNFKGHTIDESSLTNIKLGFFAPNLTSKVQHLDQGIIRAFKAHYRRM